jgi:general secretion pathway protein G
MIWRKRFLRSGGTKSEKSIGLRENREAGFTLIELLVVLVILVLLAGVVGPRVIGYLGSSKAKVAKLQIENFASSLELFRIDVGRYPTSAEGLKALTEKPVGVLIWNGPYLKKNDAPVDPWGRPYIYVAPGKSGPFDLSSLGADGTRGGEGEDADITN